jgi:hypothetical protein
MTVSVQLVRSVAIALVALCCTAPVAHAQDSATGVSLQLNRADPEGEACRMTFVAGNTTGGDLSAAAYEMAVYNKEGQVSQLVVMDFGPLVNGRTRVVQFDMPASDCTSIARLTINDPPANCGVADGASAEACTANRKLESLTDIAFE